MARRRRAERRGSFPRIFPRGARSKVAVLYAPRVGILCNTGGRMEKVKVLHSDRVANGEAFPGERVIRVRVDTYNAKCGRSYTQRIPTEGKPGRGW